jgi:glycosyltransferase involved in cell wall biosynthesis
MKLAVVTPRYGREVAGGAETAARLLATQLARRTAWQVEALTTTALDSTSWQPHFGPGDDTVDGVSVRRFPVVAHRGRDFDSATARVIARGKRVTAAEELRWIEQQGPVAPDLIDAIRTTDADVVAFHPYLYHPTVAGLPTVAPRALLHPATHDEAVIRLPVFQEVFASSSALAYWSDTERRLTERLFPVASTPALVVGLGVDAADGDDANARAVVGVDERPFLLCLGRVDDGKGVRVLGDSFTVYKERRPGPLKLVFAGPVVHRPVSHPDIVVAGAVDEDVKWGLLRGATALVSPSAFESFSIVLMEAWTVGTPAMVNARCGVTSEHARRSRGALEFAGYAEFEVALDRLMGSADLRARLGQAGREYVDRHYRWSDVTERYGAFLASIAERARSRFQQPA